MKRAVLAVAIILMAMLPAVFVEGSDASDPAYQDPPQADHVFQITMSDLTSNTPTQRVVYDMNSSSNEYLMAMAVACADYGKTGYSYEEQHLLPSWVGWSTEVKYGDPERSSLTVSVSPALQQVSEDTHGDYWIWFECTYPNFLSYETTTFLIMIHLDVSWAGTVIVPDSVFHTYRLTYDSLGGSIHLSEVNVVPAELDDGVSMFVTSDKVPVKAGHVFKGWSTSSGQDQKVDVSDDYPFVSSRADHVDDSDPNNIVYDKTVYAVWGESNPFIPDNLKGAAELLTDPAVIIPASVFLLGLAFFVGGHNRRR